MTWWLASDCTNAHKGKSVSSSSSFEVQEPKWQRQVGPNLENFLVHWSAAGMQKSTTGATNSQVTCFRCQWMDGLGMAGNNNGYLPLINCCIGSFTLGRVSRKTKEKKKCQTLLSQFQPHPSFSKTAAKPLTYVLVTLHLAQVVAI